jgi:biopolymer transport protein TolR
MANVRRLLRRAIRVRGEGEAGTGELNIVPFLDIVTNLMLFLLATTAAIATVSEVRADLPGHGPRSGAPPLELSVTLTDRGAIMATSIGRVGPDCVIAPSAAPTAARTADGYDLASLGRCAAELHRAHPHEDAVVLSADPLVPYRDLVGAMDAIRSRGDELLFPDVRISAGVR